MAANASILRPRAPAVSKPGTVGLWHQLLSGVPYKTFMQATGNHDSTLWRGSCMRLAGQKLDEVRRRVQNETLGHRGRKHDPLHGARRLLVLPRNGSMNAPRAI
jgi:hypothetical protein